MSGQKNDKVSSPDNKLGPRPFSRRQRADPQKMMLPPGHEKQQFIFYINSYPIRRLPAGALTLTSSFLHYLYSPPRTGVLNKADFMLSNRS